MPTKSHPRTRRKSLKKRRTGSRRAIRIAATGLGMEQLEPRLLLATCDSTAGDVPVCQGPLTSDPQGREWLLITGTSGNDIIDLRHVGPEPGRHRVTIRSEFDTPSTFYAQKDVVIDKDTLIRIQGGDGNDAITAERMAESFNTTGAQIVGGRGRDTIFASMIVPQEFEALESKFSVFSLYGGRLDGDDGPDDQDVIFGSELQDLIRGGLGDDVLYGLGGGDFMLGGRGNDQLFGGDGSDRMYGNGSDTESLQFDDGPDLLDGGGSSNSIAPTFDDIVMNSSGAVSSYAVELVSGTYVYRGDEDRNELRIQSDDAHMSFSEDGQTWTDLKYKTLYFHGFGGNDVLTWSPAGFGFDDFAIHAFGGDGNDHLAASQGGFLQGGDGYDTADYSGLAEDLRLNLSARVIYDNTRTPELRVPPTTIVRNIERVLSGPGDDTIIGREFRDNGTTPFGNLIEAGAGDDTILTFAGNDTIEGGSGKNQLAGGEGLDHYLFDGAPWGEHTIIDPSQIDLDFTRFNGFLGGTTGISYTQDSESQQLCKDAHACDYVNEPFVLKMPFFIDSSKPRGGTYSWEHVVSIEGSRLNDTIYSFSFADNFESRRFPVTIFGNAGDDILWSHRIASGDDYIYGGPGNDQLWGGNGVDHLFGGPGNDVLHGGAGDDWFSGGDGCDVFEDVQSNEYRDYGQQDSDCLTPFTIRGTEGDDVVRLKEDNGFVFYEVNGIRKTRLCLDNGVDTECSISRDFSIVVELKSGDDQFINETDIPVTVYGGDGDDAIVGGHGGDALFGDDGNDVIYGGLGLDELFGGDGNDVLITGTGEDRAGDGQTDTYWGGFGDDYVVYSRADGEEIINRKIEGRMALEDLTDNADGVTASENENHGNFVLSAGVYGNAGILLTAGVSQGMLIAFSPSTFGIYHYSSNGIGLALQAGLGFGVEIGAYWAPISEIAGWGSSVSVGTSGEVHVPIEVGLTGVLNSSFEPIGVMGTFGITADATQLLPFPLPDISVGFSIGYTNITQIYSTGQSSFTDFENQFDFLVDDSSNETAYFRPAICFVGDCIVDPPAETALARYQFEEATDSSVAADATGNYAGSINNGLTLEQPSAYAAFGDAAEFDGVDDYVEIPRIVSDDLTLAMWVKTEQTARGTDQWWQGYGLVDGEVSNPRDDFGASIVDGKFAFGVGPIDVTAMSTTNIRDGQWHHVAATRRADSGEIIVYVDGVAQDRVIGPTGSKTAPSVLNIGRLQSGLNYFEGLLDEVAIFDRVLTPEEILDEHERFAPRFLDELVVADRFLGADHVEIKLGEPHQIFVDEVKALVPSAATGDIYVESGSTLRITAKEAAKVVPPIAQKIYFGGESYALGETGGAVYVEDAQSKRTMLPVVLADGNVFNADSAIVLPHGETQVVNEGGTLSVRNNGEVLLQKPRGEVTELHFFGGSHNATLAVGDLGLHLGQGVAMTFNGFSGNDTYRLPGAAQSLDLTKLAEGALQNVEVIDVTGAGDNDLTLSAADVVRVSSTTETIRVKADAGDSIEIGTGWQFDSTFVDDGDFLRVLTQGAATLQMEGPFDWTYPENPLDTDASGSVEPLDALLVINELNSPHFSLANKQLVDAASLAEFPNFFFDTSPDGFVSPIDVLLIVNFLNELFEGGEGESPASLNDASFLVSHRDDLFDAVGPDRSTASKGLLASRPAERFLQPSLAAIEDRASVIPSPARRLADGPRDSDLRDAIDAFFGDFKGLSKSMLDSDS